jgi:hypothetical protein
MSRGSELASVSPVPMPTKIMVIRLTQNQGDNPKRRRFTPVKRHPNSNKVLFLKTSESNPPAKTAPAKPNWRQTVNIPAWIRLRSREERMAGRAVPRKVLDIPIKLMEANAPPVMIQRFLSNGCP